jgi:hypothetical protein
MSDLEIPLTGGRTTAAVVQVGITVRRPQGTQSPFVHQLLELLASARFAGAPRYLGVDHCNREVLSFLPGFVPPDLGLFTAPQLRSAAQLLRTLHDATMCFDMRGTCEIVCHGDPSPCNAVFRDGLPYAWIDFDAAHAGSRSEDLGYAAWLWLDIGNDEWSPDSQRRRLAQFFADYGADSLIDPVAAVLAAQTKLCSRVDEPRRSKEWAEDCRIWTERHRTALSADSPNLKNANDSV